MITVRQYVNGRYSNPLPLRVVAGTVERHVFETCYEARNFVNAPANRWPNCGNYPWLIDLDVITDDECDAPTLRRKQEHERRKVWGPSY